MYCKIPAHSSWLFLFRFFLTQVKEHRCHCKFCSQRIILVKILMYFHVRLWYYVLTIHNSDKLHKWDYDFLFHFISCRKHLQIMFNVWTGGISELTLNVCIHLYIGERFRIFRYHFKEYFIVMHLPMDLSPAFHLQSRLLIFNAIFNVLFSNSPFLIIFYMIKEQLTLNIYFIFSHVTKFLTSQYLSLHPTF